MKCWNQHCQHCHTHNFGNLEIFEAKKEALPEKLGNVDYDSTPACSPGKEYSQYYYRGNDDKIWVR